MRELRIIEFDDRIEIWDGKRLVAYGKKSTEDDLLTFTSYLGYTSPEGKEEFVTQVVGDWARQCKMTDKSRDPRYLELLFEAHYKKIVKHSLEGEE